MYVVIYLPVFPYWKDKIIHKDDLESAPYQNGNNAHFCALLSLTPEFLKTEAEM